MFRAALIKHVHRQWFLGLLIKHKLAWLLSIQKGQIHCRDNIVVSVPNVRVHCYTSLAGGVDAQRVSSAWAACPALRPGRAQWCR